jgi:inosine-uridine nucleoside N-ribohydrolase
MKSIDLIFDTDVGSDCDDMMALAYLIYAQRKGYCNLKAITHCQCTPYGIPAIRALFRFFGEPVPPIGRMVGGVVLEDRYAEKVAKVFATDEDYAEASTAVSLLRKTLSECKEKCVICAVGQFTNIAQLLESKADDISPLDGISLVKEKCEKMVLMAGKFREDENGVYSADWNIRCDIPSAKVMFELSPVPFVILPSETGKFMMTGKAACDKYGESNPLTKSFFCFFNARNGRHSWDPATAVYCCEGVKHYLSETENGYVTLTDGGITYFKPDKSGNCTVLVNKTDGCTEAESKARMAKYIDECVEEVLSNVQ